VQGLARRRRAGVDEARRHLEQSVAERPAVEQLAEDLRREAAKNNFARRVDASLRGRRT
jgi:hypothetical protein